jgi:DNA-binding transcriptional regulator YiaG
MKVKKLRLSKMKELRLKADLTAQDVAIKLGISVSTVANWDQGRTFPNFDPAQMLELIKLYNCTLDDLANACKREVKVGN